MRVLRARLSDASAIAHPIRANADDCELLFLHVLAGELTLMGDACGRQVLSTGDCCVVPAVAQFTLGVAADCQFLQVRVRDADFG